MFKYHSISTGVCNFLFPLFIIYLLYIALICFCIVLGCSGGAMVLGKFPVAGRPTNSDYSRARTRCACSGCGWELFGHFFSRLPFLFSFSLSLETARCRRKYCLKGPLSPKQPTKHQTCFVLLIICVYIATDNMIKYV